MDGPSLAVQTIRDADAAGAAHAGGKAAALLADAKSELSYAQHLPGDPDHARRLYLMAEADAELALVLTRSQRYEHRLAQTENHELTVSAATP